MPIPDATTAAYSLAPSEVARAEAVGPPAKPVARTGLTRHVAAHPDLVLSLGLLGLALVPRLLYLLWAPPFIGGDSAQYFQPVYDLMTSGKFTLSLKRPPIYS